MILHLLKTDWQRLRKPVVIVWIILLLTALPWLLHDPDSFSVPMSIRSSMDGSLDRLGFSIRSPFPQELFMFLAFASSMLLATGIGMHDVHWQAASPIRRWQRLVAKALAVFLFVVAPGLLVGAGVMLLHGFSAALVVAAACGIGLTSILLHGTAAFFGRWCGSFWSWSAALACLFGLQRVLGIWIGVHGFSGGSFSDWSSGSGPRLWVAGALSLLAVALLPRLFRRRPGSAGAIVVAVLALALSGFASRKVPRTVWLPRGDIDTSGIEAVIGPEGIQVTTEQRSVFGRSSIHHGYRASILTTGAPADTHLYWQSRDRPVEPGEILSAFAGTTAGFTAIGAALPAPLIRGVGSSRSSFEIVQPEGGSAVKPPAEVELTGFAIRYEPLADLPLGEIPVSAGAGDFAINARLHFAASHGPLCEVTLRHPVLGVSRNAASLAADEVWYGGRACDFFLYLPAIGSCVELSASLSQISPLPGGGTWNRYVLATVDGVRPSPESLEGARLIALNPVLLDVIQRDLKIPASAKPLPAETSDWMLAYRYGLSAATYAEILRPARPDPATCTEEEFARYLRAVSSMFPGDTAGRDLDEYAARFPKLIALHARHQRAAACVESGVPESAKGKVLAAIDSPEQALRLARSLRDRGWQGEAREALMSCLEPPFMARYGGSIYPVVGALAEIEDPATYSALLGAYRQTGHSHLYEIIRPLPGIGPALNRVIEEISEELPESHVPYQLRSHSVDEALSQFRAPVSHGSKVAFTKFLNFLQEAGRSPEVYLPNHQLEALIRAEPAPGESQVAWRALIEGKSADDFAYDSLARLWRLLPTQR